MTATQQYQEKIEQLSVVNTRLSAELAKALSSNAAMAKDRARLCEQIVDAQNEAEDLRLRSLRKAIEDAQRTATPEVEALRDENAELHRKLGESEAQCQDLADGLENALRIIKDLRAELGEQDTRVMGIREMGT